jgi:AcrR family transcriptional regulator
MPKTAQTKARDIARTPKQKRGIQTRTNIMAAGERLFVKHGFHNVPVESIAEAAGVSVGSFYAYFNDKHELLLAVIDQLLRRISDHLNASMETITDDAGKTVHGFLTGAVRVMFEAHNTAPGMLRETSRMAMLDDAVQTRLNEVDAPVQKIIADALKHRLGWKKQQAETAAYVIYHAVEGVIHRLVLHPGEVKQDKAIKELTDMLSAYLDNQPPAARTGAS